MIGKSARAGDVCGLIFRTLLFQPVLRRPYDLSWIPSNKGRQLKLALCLFPFIYLFLLSSLSNFFPLFLSPCLSSLLYRFYQVTERTTSCQQVRVCCASYSARPSSATVTATAPSASQLCSLLRILTSGKNSVSNQFVADSTVCSCNSQNKTKAFASTHYQYGQLLVRWLFQNLSVALLPPVYQVVFRINCM